MNKNKNVKGNFHSRITLKDVFEYAENHEKAIFGVGHKLTLTRNRNDAVLDKAAGIGDARVLIDLFHWYVPHYTPSLQKQGILIKQIISNAATELR